MARASTTWKKGQSGNLDGKPPGYQDFIVRAKYLIGLHNIDEIRKIVADEKLFGKQSVFDGMVMRRIAEAVSDNGRGSMDSLLDRLLGKPPQFIETKNETSVEYKSISETSEWIEETLGGGSSKPSTKPVPK